MFQQTVSLLFVVLYFLLCSSARTEKAATILLTLLSLCAVPSYGAKGWMAAHAAHLGLRVHQCARRRGQPYAPPRIALTAAMCAYHLHCDYAAINPYWFVVRGHVVASIAAVLPRAPCKLLGAAALWVAASWFVWSHQIDGYTLLYAATVLPHTTYGHAKQFAQRRRAKRA